MKRTTVFIIALLFTCTLMAQPLYVGSYNIRYNVSDDIAEGNSWKQRCPHLCDFINFEQPVVFGAQEVLADQLHDLLQGLDNSG